MRQNFIPAIIVAIVCAVFFRYIYLRYSSKQTRSVLIVFALTLAIPAALFFSNHVTMIPYDDWFIELHSIPGAEITAGLVGAILGIMFASNKLRPAQLNGPILILSCVFSAALITVPFLYQLYTPVDYASLNDSWSGEVCLQTSGYTCVPACVVTSIRKLGGHLTEPILAREAGSTSMGTEVWYLKRALRNHGYEPKFLNIKSYRDAPINSILGVKLVSGIGHVVVVLEKDHKGVTIAEPLEGKKMYTWKSFKDRYSPGRMCIIIERLNAIN